MERKGMENGVFIESVGRGGLLDKIMSVSSEGE